MSGNDKSNPFDLIQYYLNFVLQQNESDRRNIEERGLEYISALKAARNKILSGIAFVIAFLLAVASLNIMQQEMLAASLGLIVAAIALFFIIDVLIRNSSIVFLRIKAARYEPIIALTQIVDNYITLMFEVTMTAEHLRALLKYLKLVSSLRTELIEEYKRASKTRSLLTERPYYDLLRKTEESFASQALDYYLNNRDELIKDDIIQIYESTVARTMGAETILQKYERLAANRTPVEYKNKEYGVEIVFPIAWQLNQINLKGKKKAKRFEKTIVIANPIKEGNQVTFSIAVLDYNTLLNKPKSLEDVISFQLSMIKDDPGVTIDREDNFSIGGFTGRIIIYTNNFRGLVDKDVRIWIISGDTVFQFSLKASNSILFDAYYPISLDIMKTVIITT